MKKEKQNTLAITPPAEEKLPEIVKDETSVEAFIAQAIAANVPVETLEKLLALREKVNAEKAKAKFISSLSAFQNNCPVIEKTKQVLNKDGRTIRYQYAPLDGIASQILKPLSENRLSYSWDSLHKDNHMVVTCKLTHVLGHSETSTMEIPIVESEGFMTSPQKYASALTYAKRYTLLNVLGIATADEDTDAVDVGKEKNAKSDKAKIIFLLRTLGHSTGTKEEIAVATGKTAKIPLEEKNYGEIVARLEMLVKERHEYESSKI